MSAVFMCDSCGSMFSQNSEGYEQYSRRRRVKSGAPESAMPYMDVDQIMHVCKKCADGNVSAIQPKLPDGVGLPELG